MSVNSLNKAFERIHAGEFEIPADSISDMSREERRKAQNELTLKFKQMLAELYEVVNHPKESLLFSISWDIGHSCGYSEVAIHYDILVELIK